METISASDNDAESAMAAVRMFFAGDIEQGVQYYRANLAMSQAQPPIGLHLSMLESAGQAEAARALLDLGLRRGLDVSVVAARMSESPQDRLQDYEGLFARGIINPRMITRYVKALLQLGKTSEVAQIFDHTRLLRSIILDDTLPGGEPLSQAVAEEIGARADAPDTRKSNAPAQEMLRIRKLAFDPHPAFRTLMKAVEREAAKHLQEWSASDHPFARHIEREHRPRAWGLVSHGPGKVDRHSHRRAWVTCVYYPAGVADGVTGGELVVGAPEDSENLTGWPEARITPEPGMLVLMPSYYTHWTTPYDHPGLRMSITIDLDPQRKSINGAVDS